MAGQKRKPRNISLSDAEFEKSKDVSRMLLNEVNVSKLLRTLVAKIKENPALWNS